MTAKDIRQAFLDFFESKQHKIVPSAPIVVKNDPTLMFTNAGMNQFKDFFLGNSVSDNKRVADTQKCLRVSGKHNDLEEVGVDTYHHTMFEMLGNWSFGDYFKEEAIDWAWEILTEVYGVPKDRIYVSVFGGDKGDGLERDGEAAKYWEKHVDPSRILDYDKSDNFWEMGDVGPCGPCSEIHVDARTDEERAKVDGKTLVNADHPQVIEIWNLVFIQFNRNSKGELEKLPAQHVDTGMGFERLCMVLQGKGSTYDIDLFDDFFALLEKRTGKKYTGGDDKQNIALRVVVDHIRAITFAIVDGQLPSNNGAGYVIRRILRRAVRYIYSVLDYKQTLLNELVPVLANTYQEIFPEVKKQEAFIQKVILEEENSFLRTLESGLKRFEQLSAGKTIEGKAAFELYDTFGFPIDLTRLMASEKGLTIDEAGFEAEMKKQKDRSRAATALETGDWTVVREGGETKSLAYTHSECDAQLLRYRKVTIKKKESYQMVLDQTPFYAEGGGQVGDTGLLFFGEEKIPVFDTKRENNLIVHFVSKLPSDPSANIKATINTGKRKRTESNHTATHLLHAALKSVLGDHVNQKGSLVNDDYLRFDFSHFSKLEAEELEKVEEIVNDKIFENIPLEENIVSYDEAIAAGATALFGEKYGDKVRMITFDPKYSRELCGGTHVKTTSEIGFCKITVETSVAAGVRRIEAVTNKKAMAWLKDQSKRLSTVNELLGNPPQVIKALELTVKENEHLKKQVDSFQQQQAIQLKNDLKTQAQEKNGMQVISGRLSVGSAEIVKKIAFDLKREVPSLFLVLGAEIEGKPHLTIMMDEALVESKELDASKMIREAAKHIQGGGGGQKYYATAGGKKVEGIEAAVAAVLAMS